jgi:hypothetical protein
MIDIEAKYTDNRMHVDSQQRIALALKRKVK